MVLSACSTLKHIPEAGVEDATTDRCDEEPGVPCHKNVLSCAPESVLAYCAVEKIESVKEGVRPTLTILEDLDPSNGADSNKTVIP